MHGSYTITLMNRMADLRSRDEATQAGLKRTKAGEVAAAKFHAKQLKQDKAGRLAR